MNDVQIIIANVDELLKREDNIMTQIAPMYVNKYYSHSLIEDKKQELASGYLLSKYLDIHKDEQIVCNEYGKPYLLNEQCFFNISHSGNYVVLAISDCEIGIDIEKTMKYHEAISKKVFNKEQWESLAKLSGKQKDQKFTEIWTRLECILKLEGTGFMDGWPEIQYKDYFIETIQYDSYYLSYSTKNKTQFHLIQETGSL